MATSKKNSKKSGLIEKIKALVPGKKASPGRAYKNALKNKKPSRLALTENEDPAHSPGHRHVKIDGAPAGKKTRVQDGSARNNMARDNRIARNESNQRRILSRG